MKRMTCGSKTKNENENLILNSQFSIFNSLSSLRLHQPFIPHQMEIVRNENVGGLQILIVCRVGLQIQHNGGSGQLLRNS